MKFQENEIMYLEDKSGRKHWCKVTPGMIKIQSLGTLDGSRLMNIEDGGVIDMMDRRFIAYRPGAMELIGSLDRGAQIITPKDASTILLECDIKAGDSVIEVGAGSGGLTTALLHSVAPTGHVHTLELKEGNARRVLKNVSRTGLDKYWSYEICDARETSPDKVADALIMDMPDPENALDTLINTLRNGGRLCAYIPNANQLEKIVWALRKREFSDIHAMENLQRGMEVHEGGVRPSFDMLGHTGYLVFARKHAL